MGGLACIVPRLAILPSDGIPSNPKDLPEFDRRVRACFSQTDIVKGIVDAGAALQACKILKKPDWSAADRTALYDLLDSLYADGGY